MFLLCTMFEQLHPQPQTMYTYDYDLEVGANARNMPRMVAGRAPLAKCDFVLTLVRTMVWPPSPLAAGRTVFVLWQA